MNLKLIIYISLVLLLFLVPSILGASTARTDKLNYFITAENHTIFITNNESAATSYSIEIPNGWTASGTGTCSVNATHVACDSIADGAIASYLLENPINGTILNEINEITKDNLDLIDP